MSDQWARWNIPRPGSSAGGRSAEGEGAPDRIVGDRVLTMAEAARILGVSPKTVYNMRRAGILPTVFRGVNSVGVPESAVKAAIWRRVEGTKPPEGPQGPPAPPAAPPSRAP